MLSMLLLLFLAATQAGATPPVPSQADITGVWRMCYEPGLPGISEIDTAFLVLQPDRRYVKVVAGVDTPDTTETGRYELSAEGVVLYAERRLQPNGRSDVGRLLRTTLKPLGKRRVVFWPKVEDVFDLPVLSHHGHVNYAWAKVL